MFCMHIVAFSCFVNLFSVLGIRVYLDLCYFNVIVHRRHIYFFKLY